jgi:metal-responsive CopG/Arc/MetJ family transcriptional regulator
LDEGLVNRIDRITSNRSSFIAEAVTQLLEDKANA